MKKFYFSLITVILLIGSMMAQQQQKNFINYQGVARNAANELMVDQSMTFGLSIRFGSANAAVSYEETHMLTTDANGVFSLKIGNGNAVSGDYDNLPWGSGAAFVTISINGSEVGTTELMAVPYAITSGDADDQTAAEVAYDNSVSSLSATTAQEAIDELAGGGTVDADPDPTNELQNLSFDSNTNELSLSNGNTVTIPSGGTDADADPTNELQTISFDTNTNELSLSDGNTVTIPSGGTDADADPTNELQDISLSGTELSISDGSTINLAPIIPPGGTDDQNLELNGDVLSIENGNGSVNLSIYRDDNDADPTNEHQTLSFDANTNELSLSDGNTVTLPNGGGGGTDDQNLELNGDVLGIENGNGSVDLANYRDDNDADPTNEHQTLSFDVNTNELSLSDGNTVTLPNSGGGATSIDELSDGSTANNSLFLGQNTGAGVGSANGSVAVGHFTLKNGGGTKNTALGHSALTNNTSGNNNTVTGASALYNNTSGTQNTAIGSDALFDNTIGTQNTAVGHSAMFNNSNGLGNSALGIWALFRNISGRFNSAVGAKALERNTDGNYNVAYGYETLRSNTTGNYNTALGYNALAINTNTNNNIAIGYNAQVAAPTWNNQIRIGNDAIVYAGVQVAWTVTSDKRWKTKIRELPHGLDMVSKLRPVDYVRKNNERKKREIGFIAQEVEDVLAELGYKDQGFLTKNGEGYLSLRYNDFIPVLTKAIQEQQQMIIEQQQAMKQQNDKISAMEQRLSGLETLIQVSRSHKNDTAANQHP